ncbi:GNAT family N-acetyltransferase [Nocardia pseudobrasiliensis]|uniref:GNAT family N-acetyltransferase n=1 Tax=Nocardia pseudobrasiliensis TaxID=45979 RepID=UPI00082F2074|nr:GNAT family N-acetyltransferase [Nocardia pseudobrasiliensis]
MVIRNPEPTDGLRMRLCAEDAGGPVIHSIGAYRWWSTEFSDTSAVAEIAGVTVGFAIGYLRPAPSRTLVLWQLAVATQGRDIGADLVEFLLESAARRGARAIETVIGPDEQRVVEALRAAARRHRGCLRVHTPTVMGTDADHRIRCIQSVALSLECVDQRHNHTIACGDT